MQACLCPGKDQAGTVVANANGIVGSRDVDRLNISIGNEHRRSKSTHKPRARRPERGGGRWSVRKANQSIKRGARNKHQNFPTLFLTFFVAVFSIFRTFRPTDVSVPKAAGSGRTVNFSFFL